MPYKIVRFYENKNLDTRTLKKGLTLEEAKAHCKDIESSSEACTGKAGKATTRRNGPWFDGFTSD